MHISVQCADEVPFTSKNAVAADEEANPMVGGYMRRSQQSVIRSCSFWGSAKPPEIENKPLVSEIPTLILAGEFDPVTPPDWGRLVSENLANSYFLEFPGTGHGVTHSHACPFSLTLEFLEDPEKEPESECIEEMNGPEFGQ
jgi:pimeloyl-ACP methyl ester carboxylesterase